MSHGSYRQYSSHELIDIEFNRYIPRSFHDGRNQGTVVTCVSIGNHLFSGLEQNMANCQSKIHTSALRTC